jgi:hypothetical protein
MSPAGVKVVPHVGYKDFCCFTPQHFPRSVETPPSLRSLRPKQKYKALLTKTGINNYNLQNKKQTEKKKNHDNVACKLNL